MRFHFLVFSLVVPLDMNESVLSSYCPAELEQSIEDEEIYPEDEIDEDEEADDDDDDDEQTFVTTPPPPPPPSTSIPTERGGRRKGVPKRLPIAAERFPRAEMSASNDFSFRKFRREQQRRRREHAGSRRRSAR